MKFLIIAILLPLFFFNGNILATNYYVSNTGSNSNNGLSLTAAFLTIQHAADIVVAGDSVFVENGTYTGFDFRNTNGTSSDPIVFKALGDNVLINQSGPVRDDGINVENADYIIIDGFKVNDMAGAGNGIRVVLSDFCVVRNCSTDNNAERGIFTGFTNDITVENNICSNSIDEHGIYVSNSSDRPVVRYNECFGNNNIGIHLNADLSAGGDGIISDALIYGNIIHDNNLAAGINMDGLENPSIFNNLIYNNHTAQGIALFQGDGAIPTRGARIFNNTIIVPSDGRWGIHLKDGCNENTVIYNNIILNFHSWRGSITVENTSNLTSNFNIVHDKMSASGDGSSIPLTEWQGLGFDLNTQIAPSITTVFEDPDNNNYHLISNSPAIDMGTSAVSPVVTNDLDGMPRPAGSEYDIGSYESPVALPLTYLQPFSGKIAGDEIIFSWITARETAVDKYVVQRSNNARNWEHLIELKANNIGSPYQFIDSKPMTGLSYYRLQIVDYDGTIVVSNTLSFHISKDQLFTGIYPVPAFQKVFISTKRNILRARVLDMNGKIVVDNKGHYLNELDVAFLKTGTYFLILYDDLSVSNHIILVKNK